MKHSSITFDNHINDFLINGKPLLEHLKKHEKVFPNHYIPSLLSQENTCHRLLGLSEPDLQDGATALYLCSHCGGYDGSPIATKVLIRGGHVIWEKLGYYQDHNHEKPQLFNKVRSYTFLLDDYTSLFEYLKLYEP